VKLDAYASLAAFLAHRRALRQAGAGRLSAEELARSAEMEKIIASLRPEERAALEREGAEGGFLGDGAARRHRERAEAALARELRARGVLAP
jgi:hypothetical protein